MKPGDHIVLGRALPFWLELPGLAELRLVTGHWFRAGESVVFVRPIPTCDRIFAEVLTTQGTCIVLQAMLCSSANEKNDEKND